MQHIELRTIRPELKNCNYGILTLRPKCIPIDESMVNKWWESNGWCFWNGEALAHGSRHRILNKRIRKPYDLPLALRHNSNRMWCLNKYSYSVFHHHRLTGLYRKVLMTSPSKVCHGPLLCPETNHVYYRRLFGHIRLCEPLKIRPRIAGVPCYSDKTRRRRLVYIYKSELEIISWKSEGNFDTSFVIKNNGMFFCFLLF